MMTTAKRKGGKNFLRKILCGDNAQGFATAPKRGENQKAPEQDGERHQKVFNLKFSAGFKHNRALGWMQERTTEGWPEG
jgi:hypothetical protein